jgi:hypothetical protein
MTFMSHEDMLSRKHTADLGPIRSRVRDVRRPKSAGTFYNRKLIQPDYCPTFTSMCKNAQDFTSTPPLLLHGMPINHMVI